MQHPLAATSSAGCLLGKNDLADLQKVVEAYKTDQVLRLDSSTFVRQGVFEASYCLFPDYIRNILFHNTLVATQIRSISGGFLFGLKSVTAITLEGLRGVSSIGDDFLRDCVQLTELDITSATSITTIGKCYQYHDYWERLSQGMQGTLNTDFALRFRYKYRR
eukprot:TRINITY_DN446_c0_g1_i8.p1 TRINITY_DN446_c0_g1~~TRINITY_DN446_c0_g1_i8.p1  ORF type:complete len:163 (+),score=15.67 TRINITY_DN446_c0_g1_i8:157-645(+)